MLHDFELHEFFHSPKNVHLKALLYLIDQNYKADMGDHFDENENLRQVAPL